MDTSPERKPPAPATKPHRFWLLYGVITSLLLLLMVPLLIKHLVSSPTVKQKIQQAVVKKIGGKVDWQTIGLSYSPTPAIALQQVTLNLQDQVQGKVDELRISPQILPLFIGNLQLNQLQLHRPEIILNLSGSKPAKTQMHSGSQAGLKGNLVRGFAFLAQIAPDLDLVIRDGQLLVARSQEKLLEAENLDAEFSLSADDPRSVRAILRGAVSELSIRRNDKQKTLKDVDLKSSIEMADGSISILLEQLTLKEPNLELSGNLALATRSPGITLRISGRNIDVNSTRKVALDLAGDISPIKDVFDYLRGGTVPQIIFQSQGNTVAELGNFKNFRIEGKLKQGNVSIPAIKLDLTEVLGDVLVAEGVLEGSGVSTRLDDSTGHNGTLKVGLAQGNDLFHLEIMFNVDLSQVKQILDRIVKNPQFNEEMGRITHLQGSGVGKLILGDSLARISAEVDVTKLNFSADYQRLPFPIKITSGQGAFSKNHISLQDWSGSIGHSNFTGLACQLNMEDVLNIDFKSGPSVLSFDELYPWLTSFDEKSKLFNVLTRGAGTFDLTRSSFRGAVDKPEQWQYDAAGAVKDLKVTTPRWPDEIRAVKGDFTLDAERLTFDNLEIESLDSNLRTTGTITGISQGIDQIDLTLDGTLGQDVVAWSWDLFKLPAAYTIQGPLTLSALKTTWLPGVSTSFRGDVAIKGGPNLTLDVTGQPEQLNVDKLIVTDKHSNAAVNLISGPEELNLEFAGTLQHETLDALFTHQTFGKGRLDGDFSVKATGAKRSEAFADGYLKGTNLLIPLQSGDKVAIGQIVLAADGSRVNAELMNLSWKDFVWTPVKATIDFSQGKTHVRVTEAKLCGIDSPGVLIMDGKNIALDFTLEGKGLDLATSYFCLTQGQVKETGSLDFSSRISAQGRAGELFGKVHGPLQITFTNGVIKQKVMLARLLKVLNTTEIVRGRFPDLGNEGFVYSTIQVFGEFQNGKFILDKYYMDGETLDVVGHGEIDLEQMTVSIELLAAPFQTVDSVIKKTSVVNYLLAGSLVNIPVNITGDFSDPTVRVMPVSAVSSTLLHLGERTIKSPFKLIEKLVPQRETKDK